MRVPDWIREALDGYRWLWRAQLRRGRGPRWLAALGFALRVLDDLGQAALLALEFGVRPRVQAVPAGGSINGRNTMGMRSDSVRPTVDHSANERLKAGFDSWLWSSMIVAAVIHFSTFALWPEMTAGDMRIIRDLPLEVLPVPTVDIPEAPTPLERPALPVASPVDLGEDVTIGTTTFDANPVSELAPPPPAVQSNVGATQTFTPFTVAPMVRNTSEVVRAMQREYPDVLRDAGIGGTVLVTFSIDESGQVLETTIAAGSGYAALDRAALAVADVICFSPAMNRNQYVAVRVAFPIVFRVDDRR